MAATFLPDAQPSQRRAIALIAAVTALCLALVVAFAWGRDAGYNTGYDHGHEEGRIEANRDCGEGLDAGWLGKAAAYVTPAGERWVACRVAADN